MPTYIVKSQHHMGLAILLAVTASCAPEGSAPPVVDESAASDPVVDSDVSSTEAKKAIVVKAYDAYNARDADGILALVSEDVNWPDGRTSDPDKRLTGHAALRKYWKDQWEVTRTVDTPTEVTELPDGRIKVQLDQIVRKVNGEEVSRGTYEYFFTLSDGLGSGPIKYLA